MKRISLAVVASAALLAPLTLTAPAHAADNVYTTKSLTATISGSSVTARTTVSASKSTYATYFGVCVRGTAGGNLDFWKKPATITTTGTSYTSDTKVFAPGTYTYFPCVYDGAWRTVSGGTATFTVGSTPTPTPPPTPAKPLGVGGSWTPTFADEFSGSAIDKSKWSTMEGKTMNKVVARDHNATVSDGNAVLTLPDTKNGAFISTEMVDGVGHAGGFLLPVGGYVESRVYFPGTASSLYNWPAFWCSGAAWPKAGEHDIAEVLTTGTNVGGMTVNYHSPSGAHNQGVVKGTWQNDFHVYGLHRKATSADIYYDGNLVKILQNRR